MKTLENRQLFAKSPLQKFRRRYERKKHTRICRIIETLAVAGGIFFFSHLIEVSKKVQDVPRQKHIVNNQAAIENHPETIVTQQVALVPEPKAAMFVMLGLATICYSRRKHFNPSRQRAIFQPSKMATAAA